MPAPLQEWIHPYIGPIIREANREIARTSRRPRQQQLGRWSHSETLASEIAAHLEPDVCIRVRADILATHNHRVGCLGEGRLGQNRTSDESHGEGRYTTSDECLHMPILHVRGRFVRELVHQQTGRKTAALHSGS
jgi:hypothetical protein